MGKKFILTLSIIIAALFSAGAQDYVAPPVQVSKEKVKLDGKVYYSHVVLERQTLYGISKAYEVSIEDIYAANESINLRETGLRKNSIILIPANNGNGNGKKNKNKAAAETKPQIEEPQKPDTTVAAAAPVEDVVSDNAESILDIVEPEDTTEVAAAPSFEPKNNVNIMMMLPLKAASGRGSSGYMDFYSGALMAARMKGNQGVNVNLSIYDVANGIPAIKALDYENADVIIGPVFSENLKSAINAAPANLRIVSPLDPKTESLARSHANVIQANGGSDMQFADLFSWMEKEYSVGEKIVVVYEKGREADIRKVESLLTEGGYEYSKLSYNILEGRSIDVALKARMAEGKTNRVFIVSESEAFVNDAIRNLSLLTVSSAGAYKVALYGSSKIRTFETIEAENLHNTNLHLSLPYHVNYDDARVKDFLMKYRAIFRTEPTAYAYQGYDITYFFITEIAKYGDYWYEWFTQDASNLLQTDFKFEKYNDEENSGYVNKAIRHIVYGPDYTVTSVNL